MKKFNLLRAAIISIVSTLVIEIIFFVLGLILGWFETYCKMGATCGSQLEGYLFYSTYTVIPLFILIFVIYSLYNLFKSKK